MKILKLKPGKERSLLRRHPWVFDGAIAKGGGDRGETVRVESDSGQFLAWAAYSPQSKIRARVWSFDEKQRIDAAFLGDLVVRAIAGRRWFHIPSDAMRLIHGESDGLPGLIVDRYGDTLVAQFTSAGAEKWKQVLADALLAHTGVARLYERSDTSSRALEGLPEVNGWLRGSGEVERVLQENGWQLALNIAEGHKTGFYLDQRDSRRRFYEYTRRRRFGTVLNCFSYTGGFTVAALAGLRDYTGPSLSQEAQEACVTSIDSSAVALEKAAQNVRLNGFDTARHRFVDADVNASLRTYVAQGERFDAIVLDPPKFAPTALHAERAARAYKDINRLALKLLPPGGVLFTFSCSGGISADLFHKIVASAGADAGVDGYIAERLGGAPDHPMTLEFPEGEYLKGLVVVVK